MLGYAQDTAILTLLHKKMRSSLPIIRRLRSLQKIGRLLYAVYKYHEATCKDFLHHCWTDSALAGANMPGPSFYAADVVNDSKVTVVCQNASVAAQLPSARASSRQYLPPKSCGTNDILHQRDHQYIQRIKAFRAKILPQ